MIRIDGTDRGVFVPYIDATANVDLGAFDLTTTGTGEFADVKTDQVATATTTLKSRAGTAIADASFFYIPNTDRWGAVYIQAGKDAALSRYAGWQIEFVEGTNTDQMLIDMNFGDITIQPYYEGANNYGKIYLYGNVVPGVAGNRTLGLSTARWPEIWATDVNISGDITDTTNTVTVANLKTAYDHSQDNSQAHTDYMLNTGDTSTGDYDFGAGNLETTGTLTINGAFFDSNGVDSITCGYNFEAPVLISDSFSSTTLSNFMDSSGDPWVLNVEFRAVALHSDTFFSISTGTNYIDASSDPWELHNAGFIAASIGDGVATLDSGSLTSAVNGTFSGTVQAEHLYSTDDLIVDGIAEVGGTIPAGEAGIYGTYTGTATPNTGYYGIYGEFINNPSGAYQGWRHGLRGQLTSATAQNQVHGSLRGVLGILYHTGTGAVLATEGVNAAVYHEGGAGTITEGVGGIFQILHYGANGGVITAAKGGKFVVGSLGATTGDIDEAIVGSFEANAGGALAGDNLYILKLSSTGTWNHTNKYAVYDDTGFDWYTESNITTSGTITTLGANIGDGGTTDYVEIDATGDLTFVGGAGLAYGDIFGLDETVACTVEDTWYQITFDTVGPSNDTTVSTVSNNITVLKSGAYKVGVTTCCRSGVAHDFEVMAKKNHGTVDIGCMHLFQSTSVANQVENISGSCIVSFNANDRIEVWVQCTDAAGQDFIMNHVNLNVTQVGG